MTHPDRAPTDTDIVAVFKRQFFVANKPSLFIPDWATEVGNTAAMVAEFVEHAAICGTSEHDDLRQGTRYCALEPQHNGAHFGADMTIGQGVGQA